MLMIIIKPYDGMNMQPWDIIDTWAYKNIQDGLENPYRQHIFKMWFTYFTFYFLKAILLFPIFTLSLKTTTTNKREINV